MAAQKVTKLSLAEIYKRVPPNQIQKFLHFRDKNAQYKKRVNKYPEFLPKIDWDYYRCNVRTEYVKMVDDFEKKYEELNKVFDCRHQLDTSCYFKKVDEQRMAVKSDVEAYIAESNKRIKAYEAEIERIKSMLPYDQMTCEEFVMACPDKAPLIGCGEQPTFWPHIPEEQTPGPANPQAHAEIMRLLETGEPEPEPEAPQKEKPPQAGVSSKATATATSIKSTQATNRTKPVAAEEAKKAAALDATNEAAKADKAAKKTAVELGAAEAATAKEGKRKPAKLDTTKPAAVPPKQPNSSKPKKSDNSSISKGKTPDDKGKK